MRVELAGQGDTHRMRIIRTAITLSCLSLLVACGGPANNAAVPPAQPAGATSVDIGDHVIHFSAQATDQLPPEVARTYNFVRSKNRAMLTVSIIETSTGNATIADVTVKTVNLTGQLKNVTMRTITEQQSIYYIGETAISNQETLIFDISVTPDGVDKASNVRFTRKFYTN